jgi:hypothetical protein
MAVSIRYAVVDGTAGAASQTATQNDVLPNPPRVMSGLLGSGLPGIPDMVPKRADLRCRGAGGRRQGVYGCSGEPRAEAGLSARVDLNHVTVRFAIGFRAGARVVERKLKKTHVREVLVMFCCMRIGTIVPQNDDRRMAVSGCCYATCPAGRLWDQFRFQS